jgi:YebC/PmpR family DNA-binding regulatory protein
MAGHSKWAQIKHKKAHADVKKGKLFTKIVKEIATAARLGGGDPAGNPRLRLAIEKAKAMNMPQDNVRKAIMKGTGELPGVSYEEYTYEGYGPGGVAVMMQVLTDNKNRTLPEIRHVMTKHGGSIGETGCVSWMFQQKGYLLVNKEAVSEDAVMHVVLESGAEDMKNDPEEVHYEIITSPEDFNTVKEAVQKAGLPVASAEITQLPQNYIVLDENSAEQMIKLIETLEEHDDVQNVYANFDIPDSIAEAVGR